jgi:hypothetical protein
MLRQQESMQSEMVKALQTPFAPLTDLARTNMELWEKMQAATRDAFMGGAAAKPAAENDVKTQNDSKKGK